MKSFGSCYRDRCQGLKEGFTGQSVVQARVLTHKRGFICCMSCSPKPLDPVLHPPTHTSSHCPQSSQDRSTLARRPPPVISFISSSEVEDIFVLSFPTAGRRGKTWELEGAEGSQKPDILPHEKNSPHLNRRASHKYLSFSKFLNYGFIYIKKYIFYVIYIAIL